MPHKDVSTRGRAGVPAPRDAQVPALRSGQVVAPRDAPEQAPSTLRVAIVHERFTEWAGSEKVVDQMAALWPQAPLHAAVNNPACLPDSLRGREIVTSRLQRPYELVGKYQYLLPAMPSAMKALALPNDSDLVITMHHAFGNRVTVSPQTPVLSYVLTPPRWMWEPGMLRAEQGPWPLRKGLALWSRGQKGKDRSAAQRVTTIVAISRHVQARIDRWWDRESTIIHPPVDTGYYSADDSPREDFFLLAGRLVPYKQPDIAVAAAKAAGVRLVVAGGGRMEDELKRRFAGDSGIEFVGAVSDETLRDLYRRCAALVFPGEEDFGIVMAEAQSCGAPVIARRIGGALDIVDDGISGVLYDAPAEGAEHVSALQEALQSFSRGGDDRFDHAAIAESASRFSRERFRRELLALAEQTVAESG